MPPTHTDEGLRAARVIRERWPAVGILVLSQFARPSYAFELLQTGTEGIGYMLKDRVSDLAALADGVRRIAAGGSVLDPVGRRAARRPPAARARPAGGAHRARARGARADGRGAHRTERSPRSS